LVGGYFKNVLGAFSKVYSKPKSMMLRFICAISMYRPDDRWDFLPRKKDGWVGGWVAFLFGIKTGGFPRQMRNIEIFQSVLPLPKITLEFYKKKSPRKLSYE
jgi:hypothetical protein